MENIKQILFNNWNFMRWLRLGVGIIIGVQAILHHDIMLGFFATFFLFQAITNTGCCGAGGCAVPAKKSQEDKVQDMEFKEIK
jgi:hypothetical protein